MKNYLYFSLLPEALIASMLTPEDFGNYLAVGSKKRTRGQAIFFEIDMELAKDVIPMDYINKKCVAKTDGQLKSSLYLSIYRVLENLPLKSFKSLYLTTDDGRVLELKQEKYELNTEKEGILHLYQELCPVTPRVTSKLPPSQFIKFMTETDKQLLVPKLIFVELMLGELQNDPKNGSANNLPYPNIDHLRDCLLDMNATKNKPTKTIIRHFHDVLLFRTCVNGFFVGEKNEILYYRFPSIKELEDKYYPWWRAATTLNLV